MIKILVQESEVYDRISILEVKYKNSKGDVKINLKTQIEELQGELNVVLGYDKARKIWASLEYKELYNLNNQIFEKIDKLNEWSKLIPLDMNYIADLGIDINELNYKRYLAKKHLQESYFEDKIVETKLGYE